MRPLRIEFPGALYHVTSRGDRREAYLLQLARYVVLNPVRAGICDLPETSALPHAAPCFRHCRCVMEHALR